MTIRHLFWPAVAAILAIVGALEVRSARGETQTWDEGIHIVGGLFLSEARGLFLERGTSSAGENRQCAAPDR